MKSLIAIKSVLAVAFLTSITILAALIGPQISVQAGNHENAKPAPTKTTTGSIAVSEGVARMSFGRAVNSAGFLSIQNMGKQDDVLTGASSTISKRTELHTHIRDGEVMRMRRVEGGIKVPTGKTTTLQPGGLHIMFIGLKKPLKNGDQFPLTLTFQKAGNIAITMTARKKILRGSHMGSGMKMNHGPRGSH